MSDFYASLVTHYDDLFPEDPSITRFLQETFQGRGSLLDLACGTGTYSLALARHGHRVLGADLDEAMLERAREKLGSQENPSACSFVKADMLSLEGLGPGNFDGLLCVGNSLVHLGSGELVLRALRGFFKALTPGGRLVLQIINFDRILDSGISELPELRGADSLFKRRYSLQAAAARHNPADGSRGAEAGQTSLGPVDPEPQPIFFDTELWTSGNPPRTLRHRTQLLALRSARLGSMVLRAGFERVSFLGSYGGEPYNAATSFLTILTTERPG